MVGTEYTIVQYVHLQSNFKYGRAVSIPTVHLAYRYGRHVHLKSNLYM